MTANATPSPKLRGPHAQRSAAMRQRVIVAAIQVLQRVGYAALTTQQVMDEAAVSRGAMLHHFPTKIDLIIAVAEHAALEQDRFVRRRLADVSDGVTLFLAITDATWDAVCQPSGLALIELMMASRSDAPLSERLPVVFETFQSRQSQDVWEIAQRVGIRDRATIERMVRLHRAAMRGLLIERMFSGEVGPADDAIDLLDWYKRHLTGVLIATKGLGQVSDDLPPSSGR